MKTKILLLLLFLLIPCMEYAQTWETRTEPGDELKGTVTRIRYKWQPNETEEFAFYSVGNDWKVGVARNAFKVDPTHLNKNNNFVTYATIGFYDINNNLKESWNDCELEVTNMYSVATCPDTSKKKPKGKEAVSNYLRNEKGYVRIIIPTNYGNGFDLKIPCLYNY